MHRTRGKVLGVAMAIAATGLLSACGDNDSTATSTPTLAPTTTKSAAVTPGAETSPGAQPPASESAPGSSTSERPAPVPSEFITTPSNAAPLSSRDKTFLDELKKRGITPAASDIALTAGNLVCQGKSQNAPEDQIITYVTAIAGSDPSFDESKMSVEQAGKVYYEVASNSYCDK